MANNTMSRHLSLDHLEKICMTINSKIIINSFFKKIGLMNQPLTDNVWEAIKIACNELYPNLGDSSEMITQRQASKLIDERISRQTLANKAKAGYIRTRDSKFYIDEIKQIKILLDLADILIEQKAIFPTQDISGKDVYAVIPTSITAKGRSFQDQKFVAMAHLMKSPVVLKFLEVFHEDIK